MRMITKIAATSVTAAALLGTVGVTAAAAATPSAAASGIALTAAAVDGETAASQAYHRTFAFTNNSSYTLALAGYSRTHDDDELPFPDAVVRPGQEIAFNVAYRFMEQRGVQVHFTVWDPAGNRLADFRPLLRVDFGVGLTNIEVQEIPDELGWLPPSRAFGEPQITELYDRVPPSPAAAPHP